MRPIVPCVLLLLATTTLARATGAVQPASVQFGAGAWVDVDATGKAHVIAMDGQGRLGADGRPSPLADIIATRLRERIESWEFQPPMKNGVAVPGKTHVHVLVSGEDDGSGGIRLRTLHAGTGMQLIRKPSLMPLVLEMGAAQAWRLLVRLEVDAQGHVAHARITESSVFNGRDFVARPTHLDLNRTVVRTVSQFEFEMEQVDGRPIAGAGELPIHLCMGGSAGCDDAVAVGKSAQDDETEFVAVSPAMQLKSAVAGTVL